eukprot:CAMPEP_0197001122 /NCGR_PEP_ID=MMETSP1380-20130617/5894_1 /TAXON_ID=5936 /ORGANISM="Euplotes crassus, Strain CT5" /LENGTH=160 /DNA_ID=CAMNT_0042418665 /DNA_START=36 /DNA_END=518 /DNA_ORIENTATION=-
MGHAKGYRSGTRYLFQKRFGTHGVIPLSRYYKVYKVGDIVDIKVDGAIHKGMPHKYYQGRTGRVYNVTQRAVGVVVNKRVGNRILPKRINVRIEHVQHSKCRDDFLRRMKRNEVLKKKAKAKGVRILLKRVPPGPRKGHFVSTKDNAAETVTPVPFEFLV